MFTRLKTVTLGAAVGALALLGVATSASATPVSFTITNGFFTVGSGYGTGEGKFDATFTNLFPGPQTFALNVNEMETFTFGRVTLNESNISQDETDHLGVTANLTFASPISGVVQDVAVVGTFVGQVSDSAVDYTIDFSPVTVSFGLGGSFEVNVSDLSFRMKETIPVSVNITLKSVPVPEPGSLALLGMGLLGLGVVRRRPGAN